MENDGILNHRPVMLLDRRAESTAATLPTKPQHDKVTAGSLNELDLDKELLNQYKNAKTVLDEILNDEATAANQKAQVLNTVTAILQNIAKLQQELYNVERLKLLENILIETLQKFEPLRDEFLKAYKAALEKAQ